MIAIVPFAAPHGARVGGLILPIQQVEFGIPITLADQPDLLAIPSVYQRGAGTFWVALDGDDVVGTIAVLDIGDGAGALRKMFVRASHRGTTRAIADRLLATLLDWCGAHDIRRLFLGTTAPMRAAHRFYERHGFHAIPRDALPPTFPVMAVDTKFYRRDVERPGLNSRARVC